MNVTVIALGSRGDVVPYAALGVGLKRAGHRARIATFESFLDLVRSHGLGFHPIRGDARAILHTTQGQSLSESGGGLLPMWSAIIRSYGRMAQDFARDLSPLVEMETDLIINQLPGGLYGIDLAEKIGAPMIMAAVIPLSPTGAFPMMGFPGLLARFSAYNRLTYRIAQLMVWSLFRSTINRWRVESLGLKPWPMTGYFNLLEEMGTPVINGFSPQVVARPADWGDHIHSTGYWTLDDDQWKPPEGLAQFIQSGPPPAFIGFGSMPVRDEVGTYRLLLEAVEMSGTRAVVHAGWAGIGGMGSSGRAFEIDYAPYDWLFPRMAGVVHHGGSGTTGCGLRAGVPSLAVPFVFDQFYWGRRLAELGVGPRPMAFKSLTPERLAKGLLALTGQDGYRRSADRLAKLIRSEDGIGAAVKIIDKYSL